MRHRHISMLALVLTLGGLLPCANAANIHAIYSFGDSLSDVGNVYSATGNTIPGAPYVNGQFSNGPVWVQDLAAGLGLAPLTPSLRGGTDFAYGGAETGTTPVHTAGPRDLLGTTGQLAQFQATHPAVDPNALYVIWIGNNDLRDIPAGSTAAQTAADIGAIAGNIDTVIGTLAAAGAKNFLVLTVSDLGKLPVVIAGGPAAQAGASALSALFDTTLVNGAGPVPSLTSIAVADGLNLKVLNTYSFLDAIISSPALFGFTDVVDPCVTGAVNFVGGTACAGTVAAQNQFLFWDQVHPTAAGHALIGSAALNLVVPEPMSISLIATGLFGLCLTRHRRRADPRG